MATAAQMLANQANAQHSTGPRTEEGKARSARNNTQHGLTAGILFIAPEEQPAYDALEREMREELEPDTVFQEEYFQQFLEGAWRLRKIRAIVAALFEQYDADPFVHPEAAAQIESLQCYRAAAEMLMFRSIQSLRETQVQQLTRSLHLTAKEDELVPPCATPPANILMNDTFMSIRDREIFYETFKFSFFSDRFLNPIATSEDEPQSAPVETESARAA